MQKRNHDGHLTFYLLLSGFTVDFLFSFLFDILYLFVPCNPPGWLTGHLGTRTPNNQRDKLQEDSPIELMIIKLKKWHIINWILYFCCCSKQPVHVL